MRRTLTLFALLALFITGCDSQEVVAPEWSAPEGEPALAKIEDDGLSAADVNATLSDQLVAVNVALGEKAEAYRLYSIEWIAGPGSDEAGTIILQKDVGNKQLDFDFVPFDVRREDSSGPADGEYDDITYAIDKIDGSTPSGLPGSVTAPAIRRAMATWDAVSCSDMPFTENPDFGIDIGVVAWTFGLGGSPFVFADIQHAGFNDIDFPGGVLGATYTFGFCDPCSGEDFAFTDINNDGKFDTAFSEIYYDGWTWNWVDDADSGIDVESIALHEAGHGLSQDHFGNIMINNKGNFVAKPRAIMNAFYQDPQRELFGTDNGGHCSIWAQWPQN